MTPIESIDLTTVVATDGGEYIVLHSLEAAEHNPDYVEVGRFPVEDEAIQFASQMDFSEQN